MKTQRNDPPDSYFVKDPITGKHIDMLPFFLLMNDTWYSDNGPLDMAKKIQQVHDFTSTSGSPFLGLPDINLILVAFRQTFEEMSGL